MSRWALLVILGTGIGLAISGLLWVLFLYVPLLPMWGKLLILVPLLILNTLCYPLCVWLITQASDDRSSGRRDTSRNVDVSRRDQVPGPS